MLAASPALTRIYSPEDFGRYAYVFAAIGVMAPISALRYELAIPIPDSDGEARLVAWTGLLAAAVATAATFVFCAVAWLAGLLSPPERELLLVGLPLGVFLCGVFQTLTYWAVRYSAFRSVAYARGGSGVATAAAQIAAGLAGSGSLGLLVGDLGGRAIGAVFLLRHLSRYGVGLARVSLRAVVRTARVYRGFALSSTPAALLNASSLFLPLIAVGALYGESGAGWMFMAQRVMALPSSLLGSATSQVYVSELARLAPERRAVLYQETLARTFLIGCPPIVLGAVAAPTLFPYVFGDAWRNAGWIALSLAPLYVAQLLSGVTISTLDVLQYHGLRLLREVALLALTIIVFASAHILEWPLTTALWTYAFIGGASYVASIALVHGILKRGES